MTEEECDEVMGPMVIAFNHTDDTLMQWVDLLKELKDVDAAKRAARSMVSDAANRFVPGWKQFKDTYDRWVRRMAEERAEEQMAIDQSAYSKSQFLSYEEGVEIAWVAYCDECKRLRKEPNRAFFDSILNPTSRAERRMTQAATRQRR